MSVYITSAQGVVLLALHLVLFACVAPVACGSDATLDVPADLQWSIEGQHTDLWLFESDASGGQLTQDARVTLLNAGGSTLRIESVQWLGGHPHMGLQALDVVSAWPHELAAGKSLNLRVRYVPVFGESAIGEATLRVRWGDEALVLRFGVRPQGAKGCLDSSELTFINPTTAPATRCLRLSNCGDVPFAVGAAFIAPVSASWKVTTAPVVGTVLPAPDLSPPDPAPGAVAKHMAEYCVTLQGAQPGDLLDGSLLLDVDLPSRKRFKVPLKVSWLINNNFSLSCDGATTGLRFDLEGADPGAEAKCTLHNLGQAPFKVSAMQIEAYHSGDTADVQAGFEVRAENQATGSSLQAPFALAAGAERTFIVRSLRPAAVQARNPELVIRFVHGLVPDALRIPVSAGDCGRPTAVLSGSSHGLWLGGAAGVHVPAQLSLANQGCAPLRVVTACVVPSSAPLQADPCVAAVTDGPWRLLGDNPAAQVPAWGLMLLPVRFIAPAGGLAEADAQLRLVYCDGLWQQETCSGELATVAVALRGRRDGGAGPGTLALTASEGHVGQPLHVTAKAAGAAPDDFQWRVQQRPAGAGALISPQHEVDLAPWTTFVPDVAGTWVIAASARIWSSSPTAWSTAAPVTLSVQVLP